MGNFYCEHCDATIIGSPTGYITGCEHYPVQEPHEDGGSVADLLRVMEEINLGVTDKECTTGISSTRQSESLVSPE